jgi:hypothetical protein
MFFFPEREDLINIYHKSCAAIVRHYPGK